MVNLTIDDVASITSSTLFCTALEEQRNKLHIHTLIHAFCPDSSSGLAYYKLRENLRYKKTIYYFYSCFCMHALEIKQELYSTYRGFIKQTNRNTFHLL